MNLLLLCAIISISYSCTKDEEIMTPEVEIPGVVINHLPKSSGKYIGSPAICILPDGSYISCHDEFGPKANTGKSGTTRVFRSIDKGKSWKEIAVLKDQYWSNLFYHNGVLYLLGVNRGHGDIVIRKSLDKGVSWSMPTTSKTGKLFEGAYHTAPTPITIHNGRIWRAFEYADALNSKLPDRYGVLMISAPCDSDLLNAENWSMTNYIPADGTWLNGKFRGWLEGNSIVTKDGRLIDIARVHVWPGTAERAAIINVTADGSEMYFQPSSGFCIFPGGSKKFTVRYDETTGRYLTLANNIVDGLEKEYPANVRNTLSLMSSTDLMEWTIEYTVLHHDDVKKHAFQYVDWLIDKNDLVFVSRTAWDDNEGGADSAHNANYLTFHRIENYRQYVK